MLKAPTKITFKNFTKMTLNARFTSIMKSRPPATPQTVKAQVSTEKLASEKNRRLALQMENRHTIKPAPPAVAAPPARLSVRDRLGTSKVAPTGRQPLSIGRRIAQTATSHRARGILRGALRRGGVQRQGYSYRGKNNQFSKRGGRGAAKSFVAPVNRLTRGGAVGQRNFRGKRGRGGRGRGSPVNVSKLNSELDSYMSKTKGSMDAELDAYMANVQ